MRPAASFAASTGLRHRTRIEVLILSGAAASAGAYIREDYMATVQAPTRPASSTHQAPFRNEPLTDFSRDDNARRMRAAIEKVRGQLGREYDLIIGGKHVKTQDKIRSINPAKPSEVVGLHQKAGREQVEPVMHAALRAFESWSRTPVEERAEIVFRSADILRERKFEYAAWMV